MNWRQANKLKKKIKDEIPDAKIELTALDDGDIEVKITNGLNMSFDGDHPFSGYKFSTRGWPVLVTKL